MEAKVFQGVRYRGCVDIVESFANLEDSKKEEVAEFSVYTLTRASNPDFFPSPSVNRTVKITEEELKRIVGRKKAVPEKSEELYTVIINPYSIKICKKEKKPYVNCSELETITTEMAQFTLDLVSFASLDFDIFVSFVAKNDDGTHRACYVLECSDNDSARQMFNVIKQFFEEPRISI